MADTTRPSTPPHQPPASKHAPITPEQVRRLEEARLRAKALREQQERQSQLSSRTSGLSTRQTTSSFTTVPATTGQKRSHAAISSSTVRDARNSATPHATAVLRLPNSNNGLASTQDTGIKAAKKFQRFVEYDFSKMTDTKGGFMTAEDDPFNKALNSRRDGEEEKPAGMSLKEWEQAQLRKRLRERREGPFEPGLSVLDGGAQGKKCRECGSLEIDWQWDEILHVQVCHGCKERLEKYSLLTKTEAKEDYMLTDPELRDIELLPHLEKPNPHKSTWNNMMLYLRCQVEEYAFSKKKWGSAELMDEEFARREQEKKIRKEKKFAKKMGELRKRTLVSADRKRRQGGGGEFGDTIGKGKHVHDWGAEYEDVETGQTKKRCADCGMEVEEMVF